MLPLLLASLQEGEHAEGAGATGPFSVEIGLFVWTWIVFFALLFVVWKFAWPAIVKATEQRERNISRQLEEAEKMNTEARETLEEHRRLMAGAKDEASKLVADARLVAEKEREQLLARARDEHEQLLDRAKREIQAERERAVADLRREAVELSLAAAARLVERNLDDEANRKIVVDFLSSLERRN
jgi:F-type H+-transporting ATPase subunit b